MLNNNQKLLHPIVKHIRFVAQQAIEGSHAAQLQKNTQHFFFLVALLPFRQQYAVSVPKLQYVSMVGFNKTA